MINRDIIRELSQGEEVLHYSREKLSRFKIREEDKKILSEIGIPRFAAPAIDFLKESMGGLERLSKYYGLKKELDKYMILANCEEGVVVLDELTDEIDMIKSESLDNVFVNSTLEQFIKSLLSYNKITSEIISRNKNSKHYVDNMTTEDLDKIRRDIYNIDNMAFSNNSFWYLTLVILLEKMNLNIF